MRTYTGNISKLHESAGMEKLEAGKTYKSKKGTKIDIKEIYVDASSEIPEALVVYDFETQEGQKGTETNRFPVVVTMLRNS